MSGNPSARQADPRPRVADRRQLVARVRTLCRRPVHVQHHVQQRLLLRRLQRAIDHTAVCRRPAPSVRRQELVDERPLRLVSRHPLAQHPQQRHQRRLLRIRQRAGVLQRAHQLRTEVLRGRLHVHPCLEPPQARVLQQDVAPRHGQDTAVRRDQCNELPALAVREVDLGHGEECAPVRPIMPTGLAVRQSRRGPTLEDPRPAHLRSFSHARSLAGGGPVPRGRGADRVARVPAPPGECRRYDRAGARRRQRTVGPVFVLRAGHVRVRAERMALFCLS